MRTYASVPEAEHNRTFVYGGPAFESLSDLTVGSARLEKVRVERVHEEPCLFLTFQNKRGSFFSLRLSTVATHEIRAALDAPGLA